MLKAISNSGGGSGGGGVTSLNAETGDITLTSTGMTVSITEVGNTINLEAAGGSAVAFSAITSGTNVAAAMVVGNGASLAASGTGTIVATSVITNANLTGPVTSVGNATTIANNAVTTATINTAAVTYAKIQPETASTLLGNPTGSLAAPTEITLGAGLSFTGTTLVATGGTLTEIVAGAGLTGGTITSTGTIALSIPVAVTSGGTNLQTLTAHGLLVGEGTASVALVGPADAGQLLLAQGASADPAFAVMSGDVAITSTGVSTVQSNAITTAKINNAAVTYAKIQNESAVTLLGNPTGSAANVSEITLGYGLSFSGTTLVSASSGGTVTNVSVATANGFSGTVATSTTTPVITMQTSITGILKGNGIAVSAAAPGIDYAVPAVDNWAIARYGAL